MSTALQPPFFKYQETYNYTPKAEREFSAAGTYKSGTSIPLQTTTTRPKRRGVLCSRHLQVRDEHSPANYNYTPRGTYKSGTSIPLQTTTTCPERRKVSAASNPHKRLCYTLTQSLSTTYMPRAEKGLCSKQPRPERRGILCSKHLQPPQQI